MNFEKCSGNTSYDDLENCASRNSARIGKMRKEHGDMRLYFIDETKLRVCYPIRHYLHKITLHYTL